MGHGFQQREQALSGERFAAGSANYDSAAPVVSTVVAIGHHYFKLLVKSILIEYAVAIRRFDGSH